MTQSNLPFGVSATGFVAKSQQQLINELVADIGATIGQGLDVSPVVPLGQEQAIDAEKDAELWQLAQVAYNATNRGAAQGALLDNIGNLVGIPRLPATYSSVFCTYVFSQAGTFGVGTLVGFIAGLSNQQASNAAAITSTAPVSLSGTASVTAGSTSVTFSAAQTLPVGAAIVFGSQNTQAYFLAAAMSGQTAATLTKAYTGTTNGATSASNYYSTSVLAKAPVTGASFGNALVAANAGNTGTVGAFTGQLPVTGWFSVVDTSTATIGSDVEQDTPYRLRQAQSLGAQGSCNLDAIRIAVIAALQAAPTPVIASCNVFENTSDFFDASGLPPHSYQVVVFDGLNPNTVQNNPLIAQAIWNNKPAGNRPYGAITAVAIDSQQIQRTIPFTRPAQVPLFLVFNVQIAPTANAAQVAALITAAVTAASQGQPFVAYGQTVTPSPGAATTLLPGVDVVPAAFGAIAAAQAGVVQVVSTFAGLSANPTSGALLQFPRGSVAVIASGAQGTGIVVNVTTFTP